MATFASSSAVRARAERRTPTSRSPSGSVPPGASRLSTASARRASSGVTPNDASLCGSSTTDSARVSPPTRRTSPTPVTLCRSRRSLVSTTSVISRSVRAPLGLETPTRTIGEPLTLKVSMRAGRAVGGSSSASRATRSRTSFAASFEGFSSVNCAATTAMPSEHVASSRSSPPTVPRAPSTRWAISASTCAADMPGAWMVTVTYAKSTFGKRSTGIFPRPSRPSTTVARTSTHVKTGRRKKSSTSFFISSPRPPRRRRDRPRSRSSRGRARAR